MDKPLNLLPIMSYHIPNTELFILERDEHTSICYSPLKGEISLIDNESARQISALTPDQYDLEIREFIQKMDAPLPAECKRRTPGIEQSTKLSIIPNSICNLACSYCYSAAGRSNSKISIRKIDAALNWFIDPVRIEGDFVSIFITGGGEPLATWDITSYVIAKARQLSGERGLRCHISVITNGTLITEDKIEFLVKNGCSVGVSFDVLEDVQNSNRGRFDIVKHNIKALLASGLRVMINSTIVPSSVGKIEQAVREVMAEYPGLAQYTMEPATGIDLYGSPEEMREFYDIFIREYFKAKSLALRGGLNLRFTFDDSLRGITTRHCPGKLALTPTGDLSVCHLVSSPKESRYEECIYGRITDSGIEINAEKFQKLYDRNVFAYAECNDCIAKWSCGGECFTRRSTYPREYMAEVCRFNQTVIERLLREEVKDVELS